jgi:ligand-binding SRPBCC domain-containing protein
MTHHVEFEDWVAFPIEQVFLFFANPENLPRIMPRETGTRIEALRLVAPLSLLGVSHSGPIAGVGSEIDTSFLVVRGLPFRAKWTARITEFEWNHHFGDIQEKGPFGSWHHRREFTAEAQNGVDGTVVRDRIDYSVGFGIIGDIAQKLFVDRQLRQTFQRRQRALPGLLSAT